MRYIFALAGMSSREGAVERGGSRVERKYLINPSNPDCGMDINRFPVDQLVVQ